MTYTQELEKAITDTSEIYKCLMDIGRHQGRAMQEPNPMLTVLEAARLYLEQLR